MSASEQMRAMLDQLMGTARNGPLDASEGQGGIRFTDSRVCKSFLTTCCPHEILASTRMDLGECPKMHDLALRADYEQATKTNDYYYDVDSCEHLKSFIDDCDRRTELAKKRLAETQEELSAEVTSKAEKVHVLAEAIGKKLAQAEQAGAEGKVDESMRCMEEVEDFRKKKLLAEQEYRNSMPASSYQQQKLRVCEVCSAYLGIHDNDRRLADHFGGKLHLGFIKIREKLEGLVVNHEDRRNQAREARLKEQAASASPPRFPDKGGYRRDNRDGGGRRRRSRSRSRERGGGGRRRSRSRDRYSGGGGGGGRRGGGGGGSRRSRSRSRSRDRRRRSRDRDRKRRSRSRDGGGRRSDNRERGVKKEEEDGGGSG